MGDNDAGAPVVLINGAAGTVRRNPELVGQIRALLPSGHVELTASLDEVPPALERLRATGATTLFLVGGDGSVTGTFTALLHSWPETTLPQLVVTPGGTINTIAKSLGARGQPLEMLERYLAADPRPEPRERSVLRVCAGTEAARYGMIFANGAAARWLEHYYGGPSGSVAAATLVARTLASIPLRGKLARDLFQPFRARVDIDGEVSEGSYTVAGAATVRHVGIGFAPFLTAGLHTDRFHWTATGASAGRLGSEIPAFAVGIYREGSCLQHASPHRVELQLEEPEPYTIDGDLFPKASHIVVESGPVLSFVCP